MNVTGVAKVPITDVTAPNGTTTYNGVTCNQYSLQISSSDGNAHSGVGLSPTSGSYVSPASVNVPATGSVQVYVYIPTTQSGSVSVTASASGYDNKVLAIT